MVNIWVNDNTSYFSFHSWRQFSPRISDLLSGSKTSALFNIIKPEIYLGGSDWSIRSLLLTSHPPCPVLMFAKCLLSTEAFCWNKQVLRLLWVGKPSLHLAWIIYNHGTAALINMPLVGEKDGGHFGKQCVFLWALSNMFIQSALSDAVQPQDGIVFAFQTSPVNGPMWHRKQVMQLLNYSMFFRQLIHFDLLCISWASFLINND